MSPFEIRILMHYAIYPESDAGAVISNPPILRHTIERFLKNDLLAVRDEPSRTATYRITERGRHYVESLERVPLPLNSWRTPWELIKEPI